MTDEPWAPDLGSQQLEPVKKPKDGRNRTTNRRKLSSLGHPQTKSWRDDAVIMQRIPVVMEMHNRGVPFDGMVLTINAWLRSTYPNEPPIHEGAVREDIKRGLELYRERAATVGTSAIDKHMSRLDFALDRAWAAYYDTNTRSLNKSAFLNSIRATIELQAKLDGTLTPKNNLAIIINNAAPQIAADFEYALTSAVPSLTKDQQESIRQAFHDRLMKPTVVDAPRLEDGEQ